MQPVNEAGLRGTVATKDIASGERILQIPNEATIDVGNYTLPGAVSLYSHSEPVMQKLTIYGAHEKHDVLICCLWY